MAISKQCIGIDISKGIFTACLCQRSDDGGLTFSKTLDFINDTKGFNQFLRWGKGVIARDAELVFLMEATGVYYENLAHHLYKIRKRFMLFFPIRQSIIFQVSISRPRRMLLMPGSCANWV
ncbi:MAG: hypothetical protein K0Q87_1069 [Neobacillus sp.]|jgi:hypothetical protein|nr:hypothetical protein [Neobacillus sp.]